MPRITRAAAARAAARDQNGVIEETTQITSGNEAITTAAGPTSSAEPTSATAPNNEQTPPLHPMANIKKRRSAAPIKTQRSKRVKTEDPGTPSLLKADSESPGIEEDSNADAESPGADTVETPAIATNGSSKSNPKDTTTSPQTLQSKKLKSYTQFSKTSPFPDFPHPTPSECKLAHRILASIHGPRTRPTSVVAPTNRAGCGDSPCVLDALVRTILSQNTSDKNSTRAKLSMDATYGGSDKWDAIVAGGEKKLQEAIKSGGLSVVKSKVIISILRQVKEKYGVYSLDHLHNASNEDAMTELISFQGVGPKTASCVLLFCLRRESFAVDTHVHRITGLLGWRPPKASRDETHAHLEVKVPDEDKYGLHILLVTHGKKCAECKAGGKNAGKCELRKAFRKEKGKLKEEDEIDEENVKDEDEESVDEDVKEEADRKIKVEA